MDVSENEKRLEEIFDFVNASTNSDFYRKIWKGEKVISKLPAASRDDLLHTPLSRRRYKNDRSLIKIVHTENGSFLSEWSFEDIRKERYGIRSLRPMVYMRDSHEALEKSMWCYENGMIPLIGESDASLATLAAERYDIDSLITDAESLPALTPYLESRPRPLNVLSILGSSFESKSLMAYRGYADTIRLVCALPETGAYAEALLAPDPVFTVLPECTIEQTGSAMLLTKHSHLITPIIRYTIPAYKKS